MADFSRALNDAYRQLRELPTTFRLDAGQQAVIYPPHAWRCWNLQESDPAKLHVGLPLTHRWLWDAQMGAFVAIVREAVLNAIKHANASEICCVTAPDGDHTVYIRDNGIGYGEPQ